MIRTWARTGLAAALVALGLAACGSGSGSSSGAAAGSIQIWAGYTGC